MATLASLLAQTGVVRTYRAKSPIAFQGEIPREAFIVLDGAVRSYTINASGEERIMSIYGKGSVFPLAWVLGNATNALFYYDALSDCRVLAIKKKDFDEARAGSLEITEALLEATSHEFTGLTLRITGLGQSRTIDKLAYTFYYLAFRYGLKRDGERYLINLKLTQSMLASLIGQTREGTARNLKTLVSDGIVSYKGTSYTVDRDKLVAFLGEDNFRQVIKV